MANFDWHKDRLHDVISTLEAANRLAARQAFRGDDNEEVGTAIEVVALCETAHEALDEYLNDLRPIADPT